MIGLSKSAAYQYNRYQFSKHQIQSVNWPQTFPALGLSGWLQVGSVYLKVVFNSVLTVSIPLTRPAAEYTIVFLTHILTNVICWSQTCRARRGQLPELPQSKAQQHQQQYTRLCHSFQGKPPALSSSAKERTLIVRPQKRVLTSYLTDLPDQIKPFRQSSDCREIC